MRVDKSLKAYNLETFFKIVNYSFNQFVFLNLKIFN